jgi:hypothetical protein
VVPRAWTIYFAAMCRAEVPDELPESWIEEAEREAGASVPHRLSDEPVPDPGDGDAVARVIDDVKGRIFPFHGLVG